MDNQQAYVNENDAAHWNIYDNDSGYDSNSDAESEADSGYYDSE